MATIPVNVTIPDPQVAAVLAALELYAPKLQGETNAAYVKRVVQIILKAKVKQLMSQQAAQASTQDPPITTS